MFVTSVNSVLPVLDVHTVLFAVFRVAGVCSEGESMLSVATEGQEDDDGLLYHCDVQTVFICDL